MWRWLASVCVCVAGSLIANEQRIPNSEVEGDPSTVVGGHANVITGSFVDSSTDLIVAGAEPICFSRVYSSTNWVGGNLCASWNHSFPYSFQVYPEGINSMNDTYTYCSGYIPEASGSAPKYYNLNAPYASEEDGQLYLQAWAQDWKPLCEAGITNCSSGSISGRSNILNNRATWNAKTATFLLKQADGGERTFTSAVSRWGYTLPLTVHLAYEKRPNGNYLEYEYKQGVLSKITAKNADRSKELGWIAFERPETTKTVVTTSDQRCITYTHKRYETSGGTVGSPRVRYHLDNVVLPTHQPGQCIVYEYSNHHVDVKHGKGKDYEKVKRKELLDGRYLAATYYERGNNAVGDTNIWIKGITNFHYLGRLATLQAPVGIDQTPLITHRFFYTVYDSKEGKYGFTDVRDALNHQTLYHYNPQQRPTLIEHRSGDGATPYRPSHHEHFYWGSGENAADLVCKALSDSNRIVRSCRCLKYDAKHNVIEESLCGNLTGKGTVAPVVNASGSVVNGCETYKRHFEYTNDERNLLTAEIEPNGRVTRYRYKPGTDLLVAKTINGPDGISLREFHTYDNDGVLIETIIDDGRGDDLSGGGATERRIKRIRPKEQMPCVGLPEVISEYGMDPTTGAERLISRTENSYTPTGRLAKQKHYGADGEFAFELSWQYDAMENVVAETNALGQVTTRRYDLNGNMIYEQGANSKLHHEKRYDYSNRLIADEEIHVDGTRLTTTQEYNHLSQLVASVDAFGNRTTYSYDEFGNLTETTLPALMTAEDNRQPKEIKKYDIAGNCVESINALGHTTYTTYNIRSQPLTIKHPDTSTETYTYTIDGHVETHMGRNDVVTRYTYDSLGRVICKECLSPSGELLSSTSTVYTGSHITAESDGNGNVTYHSYDYAGRLAEVICPDLTRTAYEYDSLGRNVKTVTSYGPKDTDAVAVCKKLDVLGRELEACTKDALGNIQSLVTYEYDEIGNRILVSTVTPDGPAETRMAYDARNQVIQTMDPLGNVNHVEYNYHARNGDGDKVLQIITTDALGQRTIATHDVAGRVSLLERFNPYGDNLGRHELTYDLTGHPVRRVDTVVTPEAAERQVVTEWKYNVMGQVTDITEAVGAHEQKITTSTYNACGQQIQLKVEDGPIVHFTYDPMGRLDRYTASDASFSYRYHYDANNNVVMVEDFNGNPTIREYDERNRVVSELLANGLTLRYEYDGLGRVTRLTLPDESSVTYQYNATQLQSIQRLGKDGSTHYTHTYDAYDLTNHVMDATLINGLKVHYSRDLKSRLLAYDSPTFSEVLGPYDAVGNLLARQVKDLLGPANYSFAYDDLYQLKSETGHADHRYSHDSLFNRVAKDGTSYSINALNQLTQQGDTQYSYDKRGNLRALKSKDKDHHYSYDALGRLTAVETATHKFEYTYDAFNRRMSKYTVAKTPKEGEYPELQFFLYAGQDDIGAIDNSGKITELRVLGIGLGAEIGAAVAIELKDVVYVPQSDHNGNIVALLDMQGNLMEAYRYTAFGEETILGFNGWTRWSKSVGPLDKSVVELPWRFASKRVDAETGWVFFGRRHYAPDIGRWVTPDPLGFEAGPNMYAYVMNGPLTRFDLYGLYARDRDRPRSERHERNQRRRQREDDFTSASLVSPSLPGRLVERVSDYFLPPGLRQIGMSVGRLASGRPVEGCVYCRDYPSYRYLVNGFSLPDHRVVVCNGQGNRWFEGEQFGQFVSQAFGGEQVAGVYHSGKGQFADTTTTIAMKFGYNSRSVYHLAETLNCAYRDMASGGMFAGKIDLFVTSAGAQVAYNAKSLMTREAREAVQLHALGPAKIVERGTFGQQINNISTHDPIPFIADPAGICKSYYDCNVSINFLPGEGLFDHFWTNDTYSEYINDVGEQFQNQYRKGLK